MKAWTGTRPSRVLQGRGWDLTAYLSSPGMPGPGRGRRGVAVPGMTMPKSWLEQALLRMHGRARSQGRPGHGRAQAVAVPRETMPKSWLEQAWLRRHGCAGGQAPALCAGLPAAAQGLHAAAQGLPAAAHGLPAAAHPQQLHKGVVVAAHEGRFHQSLLAATTAVALTLFADLPGAARGPLVPAHP